MTATTTSHKLIKRIKAGSFDTNKLPSYSLCLLVGIKDFQVCVVNKQTNNCILLEDYKLENIQTVNSRLEAIASIIQHHKVLSSNLWDSIKLTFKGQKFTLVPNSHFIPEVSGDYLALNSEIKTKIEEVYYYKHIQSSAVNIFACDQRLINWMKKKYQGKSIQVIHQGSALIEGVLRYDDHSKDKAMFCYFDRGLIHVMVAQEAKLHYYNQFAIRKPEEHIKYIMTVFKELGLSAQSSNLIIWGFVANSSPQMESVKKFVRNVSFGTKPNFLKFPSEFEDLSDHRYFDLFSIFLCE